MQVTRLLGIHSLDEEVGYELVVSCCLEFDSIKVTVSSLHGSHKFGELKFAVVDFHEITCHSKPFEVVSEALLFILVDSEQADEGCCDSCDMVSAILVVEDNGFDSLE